MCVDVDRWDNVFVWWQWRCAYRQGVAIEKVDRNPSFFFFFFFQSTSGIVKLLIWHRCINNKLNHTYSIDYSE